MNPYTKDVVCQIQLVYILEDENKRYYCNKLLKNIETFNNLIENLNSKDCSYLSNLKYILDNIASSYDTLEDQVYFGISQESLNYFITCADYWIFQRYASYNRSYLRQFFCRYNQCTERLLVRCPNFVKILNSNKDDAQFEGWRFSPQANKWF